MGAQAMIVSYKSKNTSKKICFNKLFSVLDDQFEKPVYTNMTVTPQLDQHVSVPVGRPGQDYVNI